MHRVELCRGRGLLRCIHVANLMWIERERESRKRTEAIPQLEPRPHPSDATNRRDLRKLDTHLLFQVRSGRNRPKAEPLQGRGRVVPQANPRHCRRPRSRRRFLCRVVRRLLGTGQDLVWHSELDLLSRLLPSGDRRREFSNQCRRFPFCHSLRWPTEFLSSRDEREVPARLAEAGSASPSARRLRRAISEYSRPPRLPVAGQSPATTRSQTDRRSFQCVDVCATPTIRYRPFPEPHARPAHVDKRCPRACRPGRIGRPAAPWQLSPIRLFPWLPRNL